MNLIFCQTFDRVLRQQQISGKQLSEVSGVSQPYISEIRKGKSNPSIEMFENLLNAAEAIKPGTRRLFASQLVGGLPVEEMALQLSNQELGQLLVAIAPRISGSVAEKPEMVAV